MFGSVLIANRGEIACRVIRTCRRLGIRAVAVHSDADSHALHVAQADQAVCIGPAPSRSSYLSIKAVLAAARTSGAEAIHPGYGFLAENPDFARACAAAGIAFVGPPARVIRALGAKDRAKSIMARAGVPVVPGSGGKAQGMKALSRAARKIGFPVIVKPVAGGGGKGLRVVARADDLADAVAASKREAKVAFGDDRVLIEAYLDNPRHVEVQIFADGHGNVVHLFERDCSIQRRYQKVIEEAPAPGLDESLRARLGAVAVRAARAAGYVGAGTVEFLLTGDDAFYFMEMNTRLQVEHPVTEMVTGQDLVEWQLRVAAGEPLTLRQEAIDLTGHAIEARLYAEDPERGFLPAAGRVTRLRLPREGPNLRIDAGIREGDSVSPHYDPLIAKLIVRDDDRAGAVRRLRRALAGVHILGPATNRGYLAALAALPAFRAGKLHTCFVARHEAALTVGGSPASEKLLALASLAVLEDRATAVRAAAARCADPHSPWHGTDGWRLNRRRGQVVAFRDGGRVVRVNALAKGDGWLLELPTGRVEGRAERWMDGGLTAELDGKRMRATVLCHGADILVAQGNDQHRIERHDPLAEAETDELTSGGLTAPLTGTVAAVLVAPGVAVERGMPLVLLEAMKMEHPVVAPADGVVESLTVAAGDQVERGAALLVFKATGE